MTQHVFFLDLKDDPRLIAEYERWHAAGNVPRPVIQGIRESGITAMEIYRSGNRLVMIARRAEDAAASGRAEADDAETAAWEALMDTFQQRLPWAAAGQKWVPATRIFDLDEQS